MQPIPPLQFLNGFGRIAKLISGDDWGGGRPLLHPLPTLLMLNCICQQHSWFSYHVKVAPVLLWHLTSAVFVQRQFFNINPDMVSISRSLTPVPPLNTEPILAVPLFFSAPTDYCDHLRLFQVDDSKQKQNKTSTLLIHEDSINNGE